MQDQTAVLPDTVVAPELVQVALVGVDVVDPAAGPEAEVGVEGGVGTPRLAERVHVRSARQVTLRVHPEDGALLEAALADLRATAELRGSLHIEPDAALERGDCIVISDAGVLDARIETQLLALQRALGAR